MARRKKPTTPDEKIQFLNDRIKEKKQELSDLKAELLQVEEEKQQAEMAQLYLEIQKQGLSIDDALSRIKTETEK